MKPTEERLFHAIDATWPPARMRTKAGWLLRDGQGGGKRVSAATALDATVALETIETAEAEMRAQGQTPLFMIRGDDMAIDQRLAERGYEIVDPVTVLAIELEKLTDIPIPPVTTFTIWEPLAIMAEIWAKGGIGPARLEVMNRAANKTAILARWNEKPAGVGFVAADEDIAMVHAVEVLQHQRRCGVARWIMRQAAFWAKEQGASTLAVLCTDANKAALGLYSSLGFAPCGKYHYRVGPKSGES